MKRMNIIGAFIVGMITLIAGNAMAQGAQVPFAGLNMSGDTTVEVTADTLGVDQASGKAVFSSNVVIGIQDMRLTADKVEVVYSSDSTEGTGAISSLYATGHVVFSNGIEAAEGDEARLDLETNTIVMTGNVILTQGGNALSSQKLRIDLNAGTALLEGRVQTIFQTGGNE